MRCATGAANATVDRMHADQHNRPKDAAALQLREALQDRAEYLQFRGLSAREAAVVAALELYLPTPKDQLL